MKCPSSLRRYMPFITVTALLIYLVLFMGTEFWLRVISTCDHAQTLSNRTTYLDGMMCRYIDTNEAIKPPLSRSLR